MRYGDDFLLFFPNEQSAINAQERCSVWLKNYLKLVIHPSSNIVLPVKNSLHFLGHYVYANTEIHVDRHMTKKMRERINYSSVTTYKSMHITETERKILSYLLIAKKHK